MAKNDWYEAGEQIKKIVQDAVDSKDFSQLGNTIANVVNDTVNDLQLVLKENLSQAQKNVQNTSYEYTNRAAAEQIRRNIAEKRKQEQLVKTQGAKVVRVKMKVPGEFSGSLLKWIGYGMGSIFGLSLAILLIVSITTGFNMMLPIGILLLMFGVNMYVGGVGKERQGLAQRFRRYKEIIGDRTYCLVEELASAIGKSSKFVQKDLHRMIGRGYFTEGYLDRKKEMLITDRSTYQQYLTTQTEYVRREIEAEAKKEAEDAKKKADMKKTQEDAKKKADMKKTQEDAKKRADFAANKNSGKITPECRELIAEGKQYIQHVHECNEKIADPDMSAKLDRLELVITRIFRETEKDPGVAGDLKKMMSYYLPTTRKLLDAYCEMNDQPIRGQNIDSTKKEIESALDTINMAFENLLDSFFEDKAWDISSDISVLNTMLAQEGLTGKDFEQK